MMENWQQVLAKSIKSGEQLRAVAPEAEKPYAFSDAAHQLFKTKIPPNFLQNNTPALLLQVLPRADESIISEGYQLDPVGDLDAMATPGLIHKYENRALFIVTGACAIHCRYCFRRHYPYADAQLSTENWQQALDYLAAHPAITEIILSGGDPLMISDEKFIELLNKLEAIPHLKQLRIHSRIPSVLPSRITDELLNALETCRFNVSLVTHINHADELNSENQVTFKRLKQSNIQLLNQSVLLAGVNNSADELIDLSEKLYDFGILPYYLHLLDAVQGAEHFAVNENDAKELINEITAKLSGYLVPRLVKEIAGKPSKTRIM